MQPVRKERFEIKSFDVDFQQNLKPSALMQFFQEVASNHAANLGGGYDVLIERGLFWALSRLKVEIIRMPNWEEVIEIETWPCGIEGLFFRRDYIVYDKDQQVAIRAVSGWILVAVANLRPQRPSQLGIALPSNSGKRALDSFPERITTHTNLVAFHKTVAYNEIDQNLHVNNTRYLDWATDCFQMAHYQSYKLAGFTLEFLSETHWGDEIELRTSTSDLKSDIEACELTTGTILFKSVMEWLRIPL